VKSNIFGLDIDNGNCQEISSTILDSTLKSERVMVVTPNVDHFLRWQKDINFRDLYSHANFCLIDGMPILWLARLLGYADCERITGVDLTLELLSKANEFNLPIAIIGGTAEVLEIANEKIAKRFPNLDLFLTMSPTPTELNDDEYLGLISNKLAVKKEKIVLLCLGSPKQEKLYADLQLHRLHTGAFLCVGATVDFIAGVKRRAPKFIQNAGLEWIFRFLQEPKRLFRRYFIENITIIPYLVRAALMRLRKK